ncbi:GH25 family lysozyme M1 (1,4-beta-N-acetylmuramidase) [Saccharopolyspora lacisalsi]|uniref:GH25 family lysozyme M1 (1,4-beta-N-acetylmuramidase) n=1 Tax=Halosaccharopolyspora lacisalsi TaxID=1000566 RepID=A0A839E488_9PSEU|nr:glycoside hydrolase family 25 protein [Halosaccharopolyspora lacisalsi]MBA8827396.1 GH25 family lysozyme M1 (1,4-beta-N-acetylmuramidase) [Halosaccharopolyspora lacisalsi]
MIFGTDISHHQGTFDMHRAKAESFEFVFMKATQGSGFVDSRFAANLDSARAAGLLVAAYHYQQGSDGAQAQVDNISAVVPTDVPVILDVEADSGDTALTADIMGRLRAAGYSMPLLYLPPWYWEQIGSPDLSGFPPLWKSRYPDNDPGYASEIYQRVPEHYWNGYGGGHVAVLQFTSKATIAGQQPVDANAYKGTTEELAQLLGEADMTPEQDAMLRRIEHELLGPRGSEGQIAGWGTALGPRTVVAMLLDLHTSMHEPRPSRVPGGSETLVPLTDAIRDTNGVVYQLPARTAAQLGAGGGVDRASVDGALRPVISEAVTEALGADSAQHEAVVDAVTARLAGAVDSPQQSESEA